MRKRSKGGGKETVDLVFIDEKELEGGSVG